MDGVIFLTNNKNTLPLADWIRQQGVPVTVCSEPITAAQVTESKPQLIVSYNYKELIRQDVIDAVGGRVINLHVSLLPWNRGASPNVWSFLDRTPKGVTIHQIDKGLDTGDIIFQEEISFDESRETFESSYEKLHNRMVELFKRHWEELYAGTFRKSPQSGSGSYHSIKDFKRMCQEINFQYSDNVAETVQKYDRFRQMKENGCE